VGESDSRESAHPRAATRGRCTSLLALVVVAASCLTTACASDEERAHERNAPFGAVYLAPAPRPDRGLETDEPDRWPP